jgi:hypothetical protein
MSTKGAAKAIVQLIGYEGALRLAQSRTDQAIAANNVAGAALKPFPRGANGLTPDAVKFSPEYRKLKMRYDQTFAELRNINALTAAIKKLAK